MDVLSDVLRVVRLSGAVFFTADFSSPWAIESPIPRTAGLRRDARGGMRRPVSHPRGRRVRGRVRGTSGDDDGERRCHRLPARRPAHHAQSRDGRTTPLTSMFSPGHADEPPQLSFGGGGRTSRFVCGYLNCDQRFSPLVEALPTMLLVRSRDDYSTIEAIDAQRQPAHRGTARVGDLVGHHAEVHDQRSQSRPSG